MNLPRSEHLLNPLSCMKIRWFCFCYQTARDSFFNFNGDPWAPPRSGQVCDRSLYTLKFLSSRRFSPISLIFLISCASIYIFPCSEANLQLLFAFYIKHFVFREILENKY